VGDSEEHSAYQATCSVSVFEVQNGPFSQDGLAIPERDKPQMKSFSQACFLLLGADLANCPARLAIGDPSQET
jgi:hypothetical protein